MRYAPNVRRAQGTMKRRPAMKKTSTVRVNGNMIFKGHKLTIGVDLGDRWSNCCVLDEAGEILLEQKLPTTPEAMKQPFEKIPRSLMALETGTHSPWVSRLLKELGHEVLVAHAQKVNLISKSTRKDDRHDARTLARLARIDPELLGPVLRSQHSRESKTTSPPCGYSKTKRNSNSRPSRLRRNLFNFLRIVTGVESTRTSRSLPRRRSSSPMSETPLTYCGVGWTRACF